MNSFNWHKEVATPLNSAQEKRAKFYEKLAGLKGAIDVDLAGLEPMDASQITAPKHIFGVLNKNYGFKITYKILKEATARGFNVDYYSSGDKLSIIKEGGQIIMKRLNKKDELQDSVVLSGVPVDASTEINEDLVNEELEPKNTLELSAKQQKIALALAKANATKAMDKVELTKVTMPAEIRYTYGSREATVKIELKEGSPIEEAMINGSHTASFNGESYESLAEALIAAKEDLLYGGIHENPDELNLQTQWGEWNERLYDYVGKRGAELVIKTDKPRRKVILIRKNGKAERIYLDQEGLSKKPPRGWTEKDCIIRIASEHKHESGSYHPNPLVAVMKAVNLLEIED